MHGLCRCKGATFKHPRLAYISVDSMEFSMVKIVKVYKVWLQLTRSGSSVLDLFSRCMSDLPRHGVAYLFRNTPQQPGILLCYKYYSSMKK